MLEAITTKQFGKNVKLAKKHGKDLNKLKSIMTMILKEEVLPIKFRDHLLTGNYRSRREYHIEPDWLLIYKPVDDAIIFERTGSHSDLFR